MPFLKDKTLYCARRGPVAVISEDEKKKVFQVLHAGTVYPQSYADVGRILFFSEEDVGRPPEDLALYAEYYPFLKKDPRFRAAWTARKKERELIRRVRAETSVIPETGEEHEVAAAAELIRRPPSMEKKDLLAYLDDKGQLKAEREHLAAVERLIDAAVSRSERDEREVDRQLRKLQQSSDNAGNAELYAEIRRKLVHRAGELTELAEHPYFARMDYLNEEGKLERVYIGKQESAELDVISWRSPVAERYYIKSENRFTVNDFLYDLILRRAFRIKNRELAALRNEYLDLTKVLGEEAAGYGISALTDPFLQDILKERKTLTGFSDIIETIQEEQYRIIRFDRTRDLMVQGCAGSGKTMIMLHRISYLVYNFREIAPENYLILAPSDSFNLFIRDMAESLQLQRIERKKVSGYYLRTVTSAGFLRDKIDLNKLKSIPYLQYLYSETAVQNARDEVRRFDEQLKAAFVGPRKQAIAEALAQNQKMGELFEKLSARLEKTPVRQSYAKPVVRFLDLFGKMRDQATYSRQVFEDLRHFVFEEESERTPAERAAMLRRFYHQCRMIVRRDFNYEEKLFSYPLFPSETLSESEAASFFELLTELTKRWKQGVMRENVQIYSLRQHIEKCRSRRETLAEGDVEIGVLARSEAEDEQKISGLKQSLAAWEAGTAEAERLTGEARRAFGEPEKLATVLKKIRNFCLEQTVDPEIAALGGKLWDFLPRFSRQEALTEQKKEIKQWVEAYLEAYRLRDQALNAILEEEPEGVEDGLWTLTRFLFEGLLTRKRAEFGEPALERISVKELPLLLWALSFYGFKPKKQFDYLFIDEAQDLSVMEFKLLRALNPGCRINCFGDINQNISAFKGLESANAEFFRDFATFNLRQNYRNTNEIVEYCNQTCGLQMIPIGVPGVAVAECPNVQEALRLLLTERGTKAVVALEPEKLRPVLEKILPAKRINLLGPKNPINYKKLNLMDVEECRGLEFTAVAVFPEGMTSREFYIACTRALDRLIVAGAGIPEKERPGGDVLPGSEDKSLAESPDGNRPEGEKA